MRQCILPLIPQYSYARVHLVKALVELRVVEQPGAKLLINNMIFSVRRSLFFNYWKLICSFLLIVVAHPKKGFQVDVWYPKLMFRKLGLNKGLFVPKSNSNFRA